MNHAFTPGSQESVSVVIHCFNAGAYIGPAIQSVLDQQWGNLEIIVVDDGSRDGSAGRVRDQFPGVRVLEQPNQGVAAARNTGIASARGSWVAFLDADDIWLPGKLQAQFAVARVQPEARVIYTAWWVWETDQLTPSAELLAQLQRADEDPQDKQRWQGPSGWIYPELLFGCEVWTTTVLMQRSLLSEVGGFDPQLRIGEDYDLWLRASRVTPIARVNQPLALYRQHLNNTTRSVPKENFRALVVERAIRQWGFEDAQGHSANARAVRRVLARCWSEYALANLAVGRLAVAAQSSGKALRLNPADAAAWKTLVRCVPAALGAPTRGSS